MYYICPDFPENILVASITCIFLKIAILPTLFNFVSLGDSSHSDAFVLKLYFCKKDRIEFFRLHLQHTFLS